MVKPDIGSESRFLPTPPAWDAPVMRVTCQNIAVLFGIEKLEWFGYQMLARFGHATHDCVDHTSTSSSTEGGSEPNLLLWGP